MGMLNKVFIVRGARTPFGKMNGALKYYDYYDLGVISVKKILENIDPFIIDEMVWGIGDTSATRDVFTPLAARQIALKSGLHESLLTTDIERACVSSTSSARMIYEKIKYGIIDCGIAGGATSFSQTPYVLQGVRNKGEFRLYDPVESMGIIGYPNMMQEVNAVAKEWGVTRDEADDWAYLSHMKYKCALINGKFDNEIIPLNELHIDEQFRRDISRVRLSELRSFEGDITAGNASGKNDGSSAILLMSERKMHSLGLEPIAELIDIISIAGNPTRTAEVPAIGIEKILRDRHLKVRDIDFFEINEAFASLVVMNFKMLGDISEKTNVNGSAISCGHANAASGVRMMINLANEVKENGGIAVGSIGGALGLADTFLLGG